MSLTFNPIEGMSPSGHGAQPIDQGLASAPDRGGLTISPERIGSRRADLVAGITLFVLGLGLFAATTLFIAALITVILA
jgi:hypothetical protein